MTAFLMVSVRLGSYLKVREGQDPLPDSAPSAEPPPGTPGTLHRDPQSDSKRARGKLPGRRRRGRWTACRGSFPNAIGITVRIPAGAPRRRSGTRSRPQEGRAEPLRPDERVPGRRMVTRPPELQNWHLEYQKYDARKICLLQISGLRRSSRDGIVTHTREIPDE